MCHMHAMWAGKLTRSGKGRRVATSPFARLYVLGESVVETADAYCLPSFDISLFCFGRWFVVSSALTKGEMMTPSSLSSLHPPVSMQECVVATHMLKRAVHVERCCCSNVG